MCSSVLVISSPHLVVLQSVAKFSSVTIRSIWVSSRAITERLTVYNGVAEGQDLSPHAPQGGQLVTSTTDLADASMGEVLVVLCIIHLLDHVKGAMCLSGQSLFLENDVCNYRWHK